MQARFIVIGALLLLCVVINTYLLALVNSRVGDVRDQVEAMAKLDMAFQKKTFGEFNAIHAEVTAALNKLQVQLDKMAEVLKTLNASAEARLIVYKEQIAILQEQIKALREEEALENGRKPGGH